MIPFVHFYAAVVVTSASLVSAHISIFHESMWGFNFSVPVGLRPEDPLANQPFEKWWFHGHLDYPPHPHDIMQLPVGQSSMTELSCDKDHTSYWESGLGYDQRSKTQPDYPCPGRTMDEFHTLGIDDLGGCALAVAYKSDVNEVQPEDFVVFSVNQTCVWSLHTYFEVPADMPPCPNGKCICAWFWVHRENTGAPQNYMTGFQCNFVNAVSTKKLGAPKVPRRCGPEPRNGNTWNYANCTYGPKQPFYWYQLERNNMFESMNTPPLYLDLYNFHDGPQNDIFENTTDTGPSSTLSRTSTSSSRTSFSSSRTSTLHSGTSTLPNGTSTPTKGPAKMAVTQTSSSSSSSTGTSTAKPTPSGSNGTTGEHDAGAHAQAADAPKSTTTTTTTAAAATGDQTTTTTTATGDTTSTITAAGGHKTTAAGGQWHHWHHHHGHHHFNEELESQSQSQSCNNLKQGNENMYKLGHPTHRYSKRAEENAPLRRAWGARHRLSLRN